MPMYWICYLNFPLVIQINKFDAIKTIIRGIRLLAMLHRFLFQVPKEGEAQQMPKSLLRRQMCRNGHFWIEITIRIVLVILFVYEIFFFSLSLFFGALKAFFPTSVVSCQFCQLKLPIALKC
jgi:hypothetical protein